MADDWNAGRVDREELRRHDLIVSIAAGVSESLDKKLDARLKPMSERIDKLWDERNEEKGARAAERRWQAILVGVATVIATLIASGAGALIQAYVPIHH